MAKAHAGVMATSPAGQESGKRTRSGAAQPAGKRKKAPAVAGVAQPPSEGSAAGKSDPKPPTAARHRLCPGRGRASQPVVAPDRGSQPVVVDGSRVLASGGASEPVALPEAVREASDSNRCRGDDTLCRICGSCPTDPNIEDEELRAVCDYRSVLVWLDPADVTGFLAAAKKTQGLL